MFKKPCVLAVALVVSAASFADPPAYVTQAPAGQWTRIASNSASSVAFSGWGSGGYPSEGGQFNELFGVWAGAAFDPSVPALYFTGGGHGSYDGNEIYAFRLDLNAWERVNNPSPHLETSASGGILPDGLPQAIHTYGEIECADNGVIYILTSGGSNRNTVWKFDPNYAARPFSHTASLSAWRNTGQSAGGGYGDGFAWDPVTRKFYGGHNVSDFFSARYYDPIANVSGDLGGTGFPNGFAPGYYVAVAIDPVRRLMYAVGGQFGGSGSYVERGTIAYNIDTRVWSDLTPTTTGDKTPERTGGGGLTYDSRRRLMWWWHGTPQTKDLFQFDYATRVWTKISPPGASPADGYDQGTFNKFRYVALYDVFVAVGGSTAASPEIWMYKPADWQPGELPPPDQLGPKPPGGLAAQ